MTRPGPSTAPTSTTATHHSVVEPAAGRIELETVQPSRNTSTAPNQAPRRAAPPPIAPLAASDIQQHLPWAEDEKRRKKHWLFSRTWQNIAALIACLIAFGAVFYAIRSYDLSVWTAKKDFWEQCQGFEEKEAQCPYKPPPHVRKKTRRAIEYFLATVSLCLVFVAIASGVYSMYRKLRRRKRCALGDSS